MTRKSIKNILFGGFVLLILTGAGTPPDPDQVEKTAQEISESTMSPFCPGRTISSCPSDQARELRGQIRTWLNSGYTPDAVRNQLLLVYGEDVRGTPEAEGFGLVGWLAPAAFVIISFALVFLKLRKMKGAASGGAKKVDRALEGRVSAALKQRM